MATLTIKNIPDELYRQLKDTAVLHRRSINSEVIICLEDALLTPKIDTDSVLAGIRKLRRRTSGHLLTDREINEAKNEGRA